MNPLELDDYHEKEVADLTGQTEFDPLPVSNCSQLIVICRKSIPMLSSLLCLYFICVMSTGGHSSKEKNLPHLEASF